MRFRPYASVTAVFAAAAVLFAACGSSSSKTQSDAKSDIAASGTRIAVTAKSFSFDPSTITVTKGTTATMVFKAKDISHDFTVKELGIHVHANGGKTTTQAVTFDRPGTYTFYCSIAGHRAAGMEGKLVVTP